MYSHADISSAYAEPGRNTKTAVSATRRKLNFEDSFFADSFMVTLLNFPTQF